MIMATKTMMAAMQLPSLTVRQRALTSLRQTARTTWNSGEEEEAEAGAAGVAAPGQALLLLLVLAGAGVPSRSSEGQLGPLLLLLLPPWAPVWLALQLEMKVRLRRVR
jgi:hypothetical protein